MELTNSSSSLVEELILIVVFGVVVSISSSLSEEEEEDAEDEETDIENTGLLFPEDFLPILPFPPYGERWVVSGEGVLELTNSALGLFLPM